MNKLTFAEKTAGKFFIAPAEAPQDPYLAGDVDSNIFDTAEEAAEQIDGVRAVFAAEGQDCAWVVSRYPSACEVTGNDEQALRAREFVAVLCEVETTPRFTVSYRGDDGLEYEISGDSVQELAEQLPEYTQVSIIVRDGQGSVRGWVHSREDWRAQ